MSAPFGEVQQRSGRQVGEVGEMEILKINAGTALLRLIIQQGDA